jgi:hypothetical protein
MQFAFSKKLKFCQSIILFYIQVFYLFFWRKKVKTKLLKYIFTNFYAHFLCQIQFEIKNHGKVKSGKQEKGKFSLQFIIICRRC